MGEGRQMEDMGGRSRENVALIGFMGAGKSEVGRLLAGRLGMEFKDLDEVVSSRAGMSIEDIFASEGESGFRERESAALREALQGDKMVISCGGGIVLDGGNVALLRGSCRVFLLRISAHKAVERLSAGDGRPLLAGGNLEERVHGLLDSRAQIYLHAAHEVVEADYASPHKLAEEIAERWWRYRSGQGDGNTPSS